MFAPNRGARVMAGSYPSLCFLVWPKKTAPTAEMHSHLAAHPQDSGESIHSLCTDRPLHHPRPGIYNAVSRSDLWALPALGTGHRLGIQNAPAGGPLQITDHRTRVALQPMFARRALLPVPGYKVKVRNRAESYSANGRAARGGRGRSGQAAQAFDTTIYSECRHT